MTNFKDSEFAPDQTLRAVGQGLESLEIVDFDLEAKEDGYFVLGKPAEPSKPKEPAKANDAGSLSSTLQSLWRSSVARAKASEPAPRDLRVLFTPEGIARLDSEGKAQRDSASVSIPNLNRLSQIFRIVGEYMNLKIGSLA
jgi:hypothetical protein